MDHKLLDYEKEFLNSYAFFKAACNSLHEVQTQADGKRKDISRCSKHLNDADSALRQLEFESRMRCENAKYDEEHRALRARTENYRKELQVAFQAFREIRARVEKLMLLQSDVDYTGIGTKGPSALQRQRLLSTSEKTQKNLYTVESSRVLALETEALGASILTDLQSQRQTIERARGRMSRVREGLQEATATLQSILRATMRNKMTAYLVFVVVVFMLAYILIRKLTPLSIFWSAISTSTEISSQKDKNRPEGKEILGSLQAANWLDSSRLDPRL